MSQIEPNIAPSWHQQGFRGLAFDRNHMLALSPTCPNSSPTWPHHGTNLASRGQHLIAIKC
eukprot:1930014-Karenia_brevis.AAC.1